MRVVILFFLAAATALAGSWTGYLVDSRCYAAEERNVNPGDTEAHIDRDMDYEIRYCSPTPKTKAFAIVDREWNRSDLDAGGNAKAADLVWRIGKKRETTVDVRGQLSGGTIVVDSISLAK